MPVINRLNETELASIPLKNEAEKVAAFLSAPVPDLASIKKQRDRIPVLFDWQQQAALVLRPFLKANGGRLHDEFRVLWEAAVFAAEQVKVDAARTWLQEQFQLVATEETGEQSEQSEQTDQSEQSGVTTSGELSEPSPADSNTQDRSQSADPVDSMGDVQADQISDH